MNVFEKLIDFLIAILLLLIFPVIYLNKKSELIEYQAMIDQTSAFIQDVIESKRVTKERYDIYYQSMNAFHQSLIIELSYEELVFEPEYQKKDKTMDPTFTNHVLTYPVRTQHNEILQILYGKNTDFTINRGGYFQVIVHFCDSNQKVIYYGGAVR